MIFPCLLWLFLIRKEEGNEMNNFFAVATQQQARLCKNLVGPVKLADPAKPVQPVKPVQPIEPLPKPVEPTPKPVR